MRRILVGLLAVATLAACGSSTGNIPDSVPGSYSLVSVNGHLLPVTDSAGNHVESGSLNLKADGTYIFSESIALAGVATSGTYVRSGDNITFTPTSAGGKAATGVDVKTTFMTLTMKVAGEGTFVLSKSLN